MRRLAPPEMPLSGIFFQVLSIAIIVTIVHPMGLPEVGLTLKRSQSAYFYLLGVGFTLVSGLCGLCGKTKTTNSTPSQPKYQPPIHQNTCSMSH